MPERPIPKTPHFVTCHCHHCAGGIEFDANDLQAEETRATECPHCHKETIINLERLTECRTPKRFSDFIGQYRVKARLELAIAAAKHRREPLGHILLVGAPGSGKATLAGILAKEMGANIKITNGPSIETAGDLAGLL